MIFIVKFNWKPVYWYVIDHIVGLRKVDYHRETRNR